MLVRIGVSVPAIHLCVRFWTPHYTKTFPPWDFIICQVIPVELLQGVDNSGFLDHLPKIKDILIALFGILKYHFKFRFELTKKFLEASEFKTMFGFNFR